jgi:hypothetical protein
MTNPIPTPIANSQPLTTNRANALLSTGPRTAAGKQRSSQNALTHGLTSRSPVLATEDPAEYQLHCRQFFDEYQPATPTESQLTQELADTALRLNRIPAFEAALLDRAANPPSAYSHRRMSLKVGCEGLIGLGSFLCCFERKK